MGHRWAALLLVTLGPCVEVAGNTTRVRYGIFGWPAPFQVGAAWRWLDQLLDHLLPGYEFEYLPQSVGGRVVKKLANDELEFSILGSTPMAWAASRKIPISIFYASVIDDHGLVVCDAVQTPQDLAGRRVAVPPVSTAHYQLLAVLNIFGLHGTRIVPMSPGNIVKAWQAKEIDAAYVWQPTRERLVDLGGHVLIDGSLVGSWGKPVYDFHAVRSNFARAHPHVVDVVARVMTLLDQDVVGDLRSRNQSDLDAMGWITGYGYNATAMVERHVSEHIFLSPVDQLSCDFFLNLSHCDDDQGLAYQLHDASKFLYQQKWLPSVLEIQQYESFVDASPLMRTFNMSNLTIDSLRDLPRLPWRYCPGPECENTARGPLELAGACNSTHVQEFPAERGNHSAALVTGSTCAWVVRPVAPGQVHLVLHFASLSREEDWLRVYDGVNSSGDMLVQLTGREIANWPPIYSSLGALYIELASSGDDFVNQAAFTMNPYEYELGVVFSWETSFSNRETCPHGCGLHGKCVSGVCLCHAGYSGGNCLSPQCSGTVRRSVPVDGINISSSATSRAAANAECRWILTSSEENSDLELSFLNFSLELNYDWVRIYDGDSCEESDMKYDFTGHDMPPTVRLSGTTTVRFSSDFFVESESGFVATLSPAPKDDCGGDTSCSGNGECPWGTCECEPGFFGPTCNMTQCLRHSGILSEDNGTIRSQALHENITGYPALQDCTWVITATPGPRGTRMIAVDLFVEMLGMEIQPWVATDSIPDFTEAIPDFFAAGPTHRNGTSARGTIQTGQTALIAGASVQTSDMYTVLRAVSDQCMSDTACGLPRGSCVSNSSSSYPSTGRCQCNGSGFATKDCQVHKDRAVRILVPEQGLGIWLTFHSDMNNPPGEDYAGVVLRYEKVWECPMDDYYSDLECSGNGDCVLGVCICDRGEPPLCQVFFEDYLWALYVAYTLAMLIVAVLVGFGLLWISTAYQQKQSLERKRLRYFERILRDAEASTSNLNTPMVLVSAAAFLDMGSLLSFEAVRSRGQLVWLDTMEQIISFKRKNCIIFLSHQWLGWGTPDPQQIHYKAMCSAIRQVVQRMSRPRTLRSETPLEQTYVWCDFVSIFQDNRQLQRLAATSLPIYCVASDVFIVVAPTARHDDTCGECGIEEYMLRGWCRAEVLAKVSGDGLSRMYLMGGEEGTSIRSITEEWFDHFDLSVFTGHFSCCALQHPDGFCDKERLVTTILGLYLLMRRRGDEPSFRMVLKRLEARKRHYFPDNYVYTSKGKPDEVRELFGPLISMADKYVRSQARNSEEEMPVRASTRWRRPSSLGNSSFVDFKRSVISKDKSASKPTSSGGSKSSFVDFKRSLVSREMSVMPFELEVGCQQLSRRCSAVAEDREWLF